MRKGIIVGLIAATMIGVGVYLVAMLSGPKKGSVEWHKREYLEVRDRLLGRTWKDAVMQFFARVTNASIFQKKQGWRSPHWNSFDRNETALIDLGFLEKRTLWFYSYSTHFPGGMVILERWDGMSLYARADHGTNAGQIVLIGVPEDMPKWEELLREMERRNGGRRGTNWEDIVRKINVPEIEK